MSSQGLVFVTSFPHPASRLCVGSVFFFWSELLLLFFGALQARLFSEEEEDEAVCCCCAYVRVFSVDEPWQPPFRHFTNRRRWQQSGAGARVAKCSCSLARIRFEPKTISRLCWAVQMENNNFTDCCGRKG